MNDAATILVPVDFSSHSRAAAERAMLMARARGDGVRLLYALHWPLIDSGDDYGASFWSDLRRIEGSKFESIVRDFQDRGPALTRRFEERDPVDAVRLAARAPGVELIVMGSNGRRGPSHGILGSVAERTLQDVLVPVLIVREGEAEAAKPIRSILFATDFSESAEKMEMIVAQWARLLGSQVEIFHAIGETAALFAPYAMTGSSDHEAELKEAAEVRMKGSLERFSQAGVSARSKIVHGFASEEITTRAESTGTQLIAMGTRGYAGLQRFRIGSVVHRVLRPPAAFSSRERAHPVVVIERVDPFPLIHHGRSDMTETHAHDERTSEESRFTGEELAFRVFSISMAGICAAILLMIVLGDY